MRFLNIASLSLLPLTWAATLPAIRQVSEPVLCSASSSQITTNGINSTLWPWQTYKSFDALPPVLAINNTGEPLFDGLVFFDSAYGTSVPAAKEQAPLIMTDTGDLVWNGPVATSQAANLRVQTFNGSQVLTYWSGQGTAGTAQIVGHGFGEVVVLDSNYTQLYTVCPKLSFNLPPNVTANCVADIHESLITSRNTMLVTAYNTTPADLTSVGGPKNGWVLDSLAVEVNITTGEVLFSWSPLAHLQINQSNYLLSGAGLNQSNPYDFFHINSIELVGENYLINSRHLWSTFLVNPKGDILWGINGKTGGDFGTLPEGGTFSWQHFARVQQLNSTNALVSWFANNNDETGQVNAKPSTCLSLLLTLPPNASSPPVLYLPNGNKFLGYGSNAVIAEYGPFTNSTNGTEGQVRWSATFGSGDLVSSYRAYKQVWHATPATKPSLVVLQASSNDTLTHCAGSSTWRGYVSWNGATDVTKYIVYTGSTNTTLTATGQASKTGFETEFVVPQGAAFVQVGAVENNGTAVTRRSSVVAVGGS
ncbi:hypothetical protein PV11_03841 [Exophiala sideris]|uniref:ASST-domain-containing protein n=1 Tax=Exophiala sideris TaxID=1016849 RepID=A0A0D1YFJ8_9EURO|nr:hypothetical protein PV11_03841 [Exophiala sideris]